MRTKFALSQRCKKIERYVTRTSTACTGRARWAIIARVTDVAALIGLRLSRKMLIREGRTCQAPFEA